MPGLRGALSVRISDGVTDRIVTRYCSGLKFTKVAPGGHRDISFRMVLPRNIFTDLGPDDRVYVYDTRTGKAIFDAYLENPTPVDGPDGQQFDIQAMGGMVRASDETRGLLYIDQDLGSWENDPAGYSSSSFDTVGAGMREQFTNGMVVPTTVFAAIRNRTLSRMGMGLGAVSAEVYGGKVDANYATILATDAPYSAFIGDTTPRLNTAHNTSTKWVGTDFAASTIASLYFQRTGVSTNVADDTTWAQFDNVYVLGQRMNRNGTLLTGSAGLISATQVLASQVVEDLLGRLLTFCDPGTAQVDATTFGITQLAWLDGVKAADALSQLAVFEPDYLWEILETQDNGKHRFNYRAWPATQADGAVKDPSTLTVRYEISARDGYQRDGSDVDLCNRILVTWTDPYGAAQVTPVTAASLGLVGLGLPVDQLGTRVKDADPVSLPDGFGSTANATRIGGQILTDKINPPKAGRAVVRRPIVDRLTGSLVMPWEIQPGYLCQVRETGDALRLTQVDYDDDSCSAALTLGTPVLTNEQRIARLQRASGIFAITG